MRTKKAGRLNGRGLELVLCRHVGCGPVERVDGHDRLEVDEESGCDHGVDEDTELEEESVNEEEDQV